MFAVNLVDQVGGHPGACLPYRSLPLLLSDMFFFVFFSIY